MKSKTKHCVDAEWVMQMLRALKAEAVIGFEAGSDTPIDYSRIRRYERALDSIIKVADNMLAAVEAASSAGLKSHNPRGGFRSARESRSHGSG